MFKKMKIATELYAVIFGIAFALIAVVVFTRVMNQRVNDQYENVISKYDVANTASANLLAAFIKNSLALSNMFNGSEIIEEDYNNAKTVVDEKRTEVLSLFEDIEGCLDEKADKDILDAVKDLETLNNNRRAIVDEIFELADKNDADGALDKYLNELSPIDSQIETEAQEISSIVSELAKEAAEEANHARTAGEVVVLIVGVVVLILAVALGVYVVKDIRGPLDETVEVVEKISIGDINVSIKKRKENEFGKLADTLTKLIEREKNVSDHANAVSQGDLTIQVRPAGDMDVLGNSLKRLVVENNRTLVNIREASAQVGVGSSQVADASQALAQGSTEQASALEQVTASINDVTEKTRVNAQNATKVNDLMLETKDDAARGNEEMTLTIQAMQEINEASENISKIIKTIDDIAFQTNILALNAAVEAARAGEHGKGFAVVAEEVRNLAAKSAEAASETEGMIEDAIQKIQHGSSLASSTAGMLEKIITSVDDIAVLMQEITNASNDQATAVSQIDQAIIQVSQVVQTNSATSEQCAAASEELSGQAKNLEQLVGKYTLRDLNGSSFTDNSIPSFTASHFSQTESQPVRNIPATSSFRASSTEAQNEQIISLEDNSYSKY